MISMLYLHGSLKAFQHQLEQFKVYQKKKRDLYEHEVHKHENNELIWFLYRNAEMRAEILVYVVCY